MQIYFSLVQENEVTSAEAAPPRAASLNDGENVYVMKRGEELEL